ncbi:hypothetical protein M514_07733 [Trichuris suis]|uniref:C2H2-type domain-containing protein n=1 Tax=Trichuris suis TaxID=68888 RepID=A0A085M282_9BILA|nr:hypothetical protein M513_07733 [Trichuris suis]KFD60395.1 hypothetical protein M514_07733 [Trichuris suis]
MNSSSSRTPTNDPKRTARGEVASSVTAEYPGPFRFSQCQFAAITAFHFINHARSHTKEVEFACSKCSKHFPSIHGVSSHYWRCKAPYELAETINVTGTSETLHGFTCVECNAVFSTHSGLQLHRLRQHPDDFAAEQHQQRKPRWTRFEIDSLHKLEAELAPTVTNINQMLHQQVHDRFSITRNVEMIKGQRRRMTYKNAVESLRLQLAKAAQVAPAVQLNSLDEGPCGSGNKIAAIASAAQIGAVHEQRDTVGPRYPRILYNAVCPA